MSHAPFTTASETTPEPLPEPAPGWTPERIRFFLEQLARSGNVVAACGKLGISRQAAYQLKRRMPAFALAWDGAILRHRDALVDACMDRALNGVCEEVVVDGRVVERTRADGATLRFMMARADRMAESREMHDRPARLAEAHLEDLMDMIDPPPIEADVADGDAAGEANGAAAPAAAPDPDRRRFDARSARDLLTYISESATADWDERVAGELHERQAARLGEAGAGPAREPAYARAIAEKRFPRHPVIDPEIEDESFTDEEREGLAYIRWLVALQEVAPEDIDISDLDPAESDSWSLSDWDRADRSGLSARMELGRPRPWEDEDEASDGAAG